MAGDLDGELRGLVERWRVAGARLAARRRSELRDIEVADHINALNGAFEATLAGPVRTTSRAGAAAGDVCAIESVASIARRRTCIVS